MLDITKETMINEILREAPEAMPMFQALGMHCLGCALSNNETLEQACLAHEINPDVFVAALREFLEEA